jgi:hypothetical protein
MCSVNYRSDLVAWILRASKEGLLRLACRTQSITVAESRNDLVAVASIGARTVIKASSSPYTILRSNMLEVKRIC